MKFFVYMLIVSAAIIIVCAAFPVLGLILLMETITPGIFVQVIQNNPEVMANITYSGLLTLKISVPLSIVTVAVCFLVRWFIKRRR